MFSSNHTLVLHLLFEIYRLLAYVTSCDPQQSFNLVKMPANIGKRKCATELMYSIVSNVLDLQKFPTAEMTSSGRKIAKQGLSDSFPGSIGVRPCVGVAYWKYAGPGHHIARRWFCVVAGVTPPWPHHPRSGRLTTRGADGQTDRQTSRRESTRRNAFQFSY